MSMSTLLEDAVKGKLFVPSKKSKTSHNSKTTRELLVTPGQVDIEPDPKVTRENRPKGFSLLYVTRACPLFQHRHKYSYPLLLPVRCFFCGRRRFKLLSHSAFVFILLSFLFCFRFYSASVFILLSFLFCFHFYFAFVFIRLSFLFCFSFY